MIWLVTIVLTIAWIISGLVHQSSSVGVDGIIPSFASPLKNMTVAAGREARLSCAVENLGVYKVAWVHFGQRGRAVLTVNAHVFTGNRRVSVVQERGAWTLIIANVEPADHGDYMCQISTVPPAKQYGHITVVVPPRITSPPSDARVMEGDDTRLSCAAVGDPTPVLTWRREDGAMFTNNHTRVMEAAGGVLMLVGVSRGDGGAFLCVAANGVPPTVSARAQVFVQYAPTVGGSEVVWALVGGRAELTCRYQGWPRPQVTWLKDSLLIEGSTESATNSAIGWLTSTLVLREVGRDDLGQYRCTVSNALGLATATVTVVEKVLTTTSTTTTTTTEKPTTTTRTPATTRASASTSTSRQGYADWKMAQMVTPARKHESASSWLVMSTESVAGDDVAHHRFVQDSVPPTSSGEPRPLYPDAAEITSEGANLVSARLLVTSAVQLFLLSLLWSHSYID